MGKYKMPTVQQFLNKKTMYGPKKDPVWVYLEREMKENIDKKPYNEKVGEWLRFLKDLRFHYYCEAKRKERRLKEEVGPPWYYEISIQQKEVLVSLKEDIHQDLIEGIPNRTRKSLSNLGITLKIQKNILLKAMADSVEDPGVFIWNLYTAVYKKPPSELRRKYDMNACIIMSCLVFIDLEECKERLSKLMGPIPPRPPPVEKKQRKNTQPKVKYGEYLQKNYIPCYCPHPSAAELKRPKSPPPPLAYKFRLRSEESYEKLCVDLNFLGKRKERNMKEKQVERICTYKFWEPPSTLRNVDPHLIQFISKQKMLKLKASPKHKSDYKNMQYQVAGVAFTGGKPHYILNAVSLLPTGYIPINGGIVVYKGEYIINLLGYWKFPKEVREKCDETCDCVAKWERAVMNYLKDSKCKCGHLYDYYNQIITKERYFYPANKHGPFWVDNAKIFQMDPMEDFIKDTVKEAMLSGVPTPEPSRPTISASGIKTDALLAALLADLSDTPLLIPHLPQANLLNNLREFVRRRVNGNISQKQHKMLILHSLRRWLDLKHIDFRARAYQIPFTLKQLANMDWSHRQLVQTLFKILLNDFVARNRLKQLQQTRLWWSTTKYDIYPSKAFLDIYFTYMPGRMQDTFLINPYSSELTPKHGAKTCPL